MKDTSIEFDKDNSKIEDNPFNYKENESKFEKDFTLENKQNISRQNEENSNDIILQGSNNTKDEQDCLFTSSAIKETQIEIPSNGFNEDIVVNQVFISQTQTKSNKYDLNVKFDDSKSSLENSSRITNNSSNSKYKIEN